MTILDSITGLSESHWCLRNGKQIADSFGFNKCILLRLVEMQIYYLFTHSTKLWVPYRDSSVQSLSYPTLCHPMNHSTSASLSITNSRSLLKLISIESMMPSRHLILCHPLLLPPSIPPSIRVFSNESTLHMRWPKYLSFSFSSSPSKEHPGLISFKMDWLDLLAVHGTLKSLLQHHSSKTSILHHSAFFTVQLSHPYMTTERP